MSDSKKLKIGSIVGGLAFGGFSFCGLNDVDADIVKWTGSVMVNDGSFASFDIDGDGDEDLLFFNSVDSSYLSQGIQISNGRIRTNGLVGSYAQVAGFDTGVGTYEISGLNTNVTPYGGGAYFQVSNIVGSDWVGSDTRNFAFDFTNTANETFFGWGTIEYNGTGEAFEITQGYFENTGAAITVGQTAVPEPSSLMLLGLGAAGLAAFRRKRSA